MTDRELMQQALEALNRSDYLGWQLNIPIIKALRERLAQPDAYGYASRLAVALWEQHYKDIAPQWKPFDDLLGVLTQIDNMTSGLTRLAQPQMHPCAGRNCGSTNPNLHSAECFEDYDKSTGMTQWVDLTDEEMKSIQMQSWNNYPEQQVSKFDAWKCQRLTKAKLKEKNT